MASKDMYVFAQAIYVLQILFIIFHFLTLYTSPHTPLGYILKYVKLNISPETHDAYSTINPPSGNFFTNSFNIDTIWTLVQQFSAEMTDIPVAFFAECIKISLSHNSIKKPTN
jgi:hypothetical protein